MMLRPMSRQDVFYSGSISSLNEYKSQLSMLSYRESTLNFEGTGASRAVLDVIEAREEEEEETDAGPPPKDDGKCKLKFLVFVFCKVDCIEPYWLIIVHSDKL